MERIVRLNAVENLWATGISGMNEHSLHPNKGLFSQKLKISGVNFITLVFLNALNKINANSLFTLKIAPSNLRFLGVLLRALLNKSLEVVSSSVLSVSMNFEIISVMKRKAKEIRQITCLFTKTQLCLVKVPNLIEPEFLVEQSRYGVKKAFYDNTAVLPISWSFSWLLTIFNQVNKVKIPLTLLTDRVCQLMHEKVASTYEDTQFREEKLAEAFTVKLRWSRVR
ncbi:hypothetical protein Riv7116_0386 [Rivularia sp. PCC 7116]|uniref:hypothetical protein n=1 Tax=Rivularia sp. PCC 7116 TaxID=373994 RepID=UPI00029F14CC|nr:hypothetical protein [Rivularia sp. PCC 7116]AFY52990.1 hypothetical protein Riv7116_0386 [Rivularia sp. PCC 7116]